MLRCEKLVKIYKGKTEVRAINDISFSINDAEIVGLLGPNGAGKTTTIKSLCCLINPSSGKIWIDGIDVTKNPYFAYNKIASVLEGNRNIYWRLTVKENLIFFAGLMGYSYKYRKDQIDELINIFKLKEKTNTEARFLSRGMQQKLAIACALIKDTEILLLDEPTLGLDVESTHEVQNLLKNEMVNKGRTILLSSHNMRVIENVCERVIVINKGKIVADEKLDSLKDFFKVNAYKFEIEGRIDNKVKEEFQKISLGTKYTENSSKTEIIIELNDFMIIYKLLETLKDNNTKLLSITRIEPDFEDIYLKLVQK
jgi:ABC-2 type transport system ATP-binding protein